jgi:lanosterol synthase
VSYCTAEALIAILETHAHPEIVSSLPERIPDERLRQALEFILSRQNADGGFGTYERRRGGAMLERLNPSEMYGSCMTERTNLECTSSAIKALTHFRAAYPGLPGTIEIAIHRGVRFLCRQQRGDGCWPGFWGVNFTYAMFHVLQALRAAGLSVTDPRLRKAANWLIARQHADGGWGEQYTGCSHDRFVDRPESQVVQTSWAVLALMEVMPVAAEPIRRGIGWLRSKQKEDGSWEQQGVTGVFIGTAMLDYRLYPSYFPVWALARFHRLWRRETI